MATPRVDKAPDSASPSRAVWCRRRGGTVGVRSTPGRGSVFHAVLNRVHDVDAPIGGPKVHPSPGDGAHRFLLVEDDPRVQLQLSNGLFEEGFRVDVASTLQSAIRRAREQVYDALTLDLTLSDGRGLDFLERIRTEGSNRSAPVIGLTMTANHQNGVSFAIANVLSKPIRTDEVELAMRRLRVRESGRTRVMVVDDDPQALDLMAAKLSAMDIDTTCFRDGRQALRELAQHRPHAIILDLMMPDFDGFEVLHALQGMPESRDIPVFIWTSMILGDWEYALLSRSAKAILGKGGGALGTMLQSLRRWRPARVDALPDPGR